MAVPKAGEAAIGVDKAGIETRLEPAGAAWEVMLPGATRHFALFGGDPPGYHYVGGSPVLIVERDGNAGAPVTRVAVL